ncbi:hypothetical protein D3C85_1306590 [compost metagenome]
MQPMPAFADKLSPEQLADLVNYLRQAWGGQPADLAADQVAQVQAEVTAEHKVH